MTDVASTEQKPKGGRPTVGVTAQRVKAELVELREKEKQRRLQTQAKREELKRLMALATARDRRIQAGKERKEEKQLTFVLGQLLLKALAQPGVAQVVVRLPEIEALKDEELRASFARYVARQRKTNSPSEPKAGGESASDSTE